MMLLNLINWGTYCSSFQICLWIDMYLQHLWPVSGLCFDKLWEWLASTGVWCTIICYTSLIPTQPLFPHPSGLHWHGKMDLIYVLHRDFDVLDVFPAHLGPQNCYTEIVDVVIRQMQCYMRVSRGHITTTHHTYQITTKTTTWHQPHIPGVAKMFPASFMCC